MSEKRKITLQFPSLRAFLSEYGERISADGILLRGVTPPEVGTTVDIEVVVSDGMRLLRARGETLWSESARPGQHDAAVVRFEEVDHAGRTVIERILEQRRREGAELFDLADVPGPREARLRDMTKPAAPEPPPASAPVPEDAIFDLVAPPATDQGELFPAAAEEEARPEPGAPTAAGPEPAEVRLSPPPVPLLADDEPAPFELGRQPTAATGADEPDVQVAAEANDLGPSAAADLSDLFGADEEPPAAVRQEPTEAFPESFLHEVEAELAADEGPSAELEAQLSGSYAEMETGELQAHLERELDESETETFDLQPAEPRRAGDGRATTEDRNAPEAEPDMGALPISPPIAGEPPADVLTEPRAEVRRVPKAEPEVPVEAAVDGPPSEPVAAAAEPGLAPPAIAPVATEAPRAVDPEMPAEPRTAAGPRGGADSAVEAGAETGAEAGPAAAAADEEAIRKGAESAAGAESAPRAGISLKVAEAFDAAYGPETVEIPVLDGRPNGTAKAAPPLVVDSALLGQPAPGTPAPPAPIPSMDDNLLSIAELGQEPAVGSAEPAEELRPAPQSLRGAASSSHHFGTWLLIALLVGALTIAGYFLFDMIRQETRPAPTPSAQVAERPGPSPVASAASSEAADQQAVEPDSPAEPPALATEEPSGAIEEPSAAIEEPSAAIEEPSAGVEEPPTAEVSPAVHAIEESPAGVLTGLERITWTEIAGQTVLALLGDGKIREDRVELLSIGGDQPRLVIKIQGVERPLQPATLDVGSAHVIRVRTGLQSGGELHVVVDLVAPDVTLRQSSYQGSRMEIRLGPE